MSACQEATQNCIEQLSGSAGPIVQAQPLGQGGQYAFPARTAAELQASSAQAAHAGQVTAHRAQAAQLEEQSAQALANGELDMFAVLQQRAGMQDPASQGMPPSAPVEVPNEPGSDQWLL